MPNVSSQLQGHVLLPSLHSSTFTIAKFHVIVLPGLQQHCLVVWLIVHPVKSKLKPKWRQAIKEAVLPGVCQHVLPNGICWFREGEPQLAHLLEAMTLTFALLYFTRDRVYDLQLCSNSTLPTVGFLMGKHAYGLVLYPWHVHFIETNQNPFKYRVHFLWFFFLGALKFLLDLKTFLTWVTNNSHSYPTNLWKGAVHELDFVAFWRSSYYRSVQDFLVKMYLIGLVMLTGNRVLGRVLLHTNKLKWMCSLLLIRQYKKTTFLQGILFILFYTSGSKLDGTVYVKHVGDYTKIKCIWRLQTVF